MRLNQKKKLQLINWILEGLEGGQFEILLKEDDSGDLDPTPVFDVEALVSEARIAGILDF
ncbi:hypothetical protein IC617_08805 [Neiella sp. HB171785]|uniref:Uncharacterized protein n=1 Tax=Neiella litorisoli TaxID=2771431 RepID=A0A8J6QQN8_9GAMM|nr:hypothetical protein [Neiella litorisoli]MBD1389526.1 hypothetical protein [Neiella litorisoli]